MRTLCDAYHKVRASAFNPGHTWVIANTCATAAWRFRHVTHGKFSLHFLNFLVRNPFHPWSPLFIISSFLFSTLENYYAQQVYQTSGTLEKVDELYLEILFRCWCRGKFEWLDDAICKQFEAQTRNLSAIVHTKRLCFVQAIYNFKLKQLKK